MFKYLNIPSITSCSVALIKYFSLLSFDNEDLFTEFCKISLK